MGLNINFFDAVIVSYIHTSTHTHGVRNVCKEKLLKRKKCCLLSKVFEMGSILDILGP